MSNGEVQTESALAAITEGRSLLRVGRNGHIFRQGEASDSVYYLRQGLVKLVARSERGREAIVAMLGSGHFFGDGCLAGQSMRLMSATAMTDCKLDKIDRPAMARALREQPSVLQSFLNHLLSRNILYEQKLQQRVAIRGLERNRTSRLFRSLLPLALTTLVSVGTSAISAAAAQDTSAAATVPWPEPIGLLAIGIFLVLGGRVLRTHFASKEP